MLNLNYSRKILPPLGCYQAQHGCLELDSSIGKFSSYFSRKCIRQEAYNGSNQKHLPESTLNIASASFYHKGISALGAKNPQDELNISDTELGRETKKAVSLPSSSQQTKEIGAILSSLEEGYLGVGFLLLSLNACKNSFVNAVFYAAHSPYLFFSSLTGTCYLSSPLAEEIRMEFVNIRTSELDSYLENLTSRKDEAESASSTLNSDSSLGIRHLSLLKRLTHQLALSLATTVALAFALSLWEISIISSYGFLVTYLALATTANIVLASHIYRRFSFATILRKELMRRSGLNQSGGNLIKIKQIGEPV